MQIHRLNIEHKYDADTEWIITHS